MRCGAVRRILTSGFGAWGMAGQVGGAQSGWQRQGYSAMFLLVYRALQACRLAGSGLVEWAWVGVEHRVLLVRMATVDIMGTRLARGINGHTYMTLEHDFTNVVCRYTPKLIVLTAINVSYLGTVLSRLSSRYAPGHGNSDTRITFLCWHWASGRMGRCSWQKRQVRLLFTPTGICSAILLGGCKVALWRFAFSLV